MDYLGAGRGGVAGRTTREFLYPDSAPLDPAALPLPAPHEDEEAVLKDTGLDRGDAQLAPILDGFLDKCQIPRQRGMGFDGCDDRGHEVYRDGGHSVCGLDGSDDRDLDPQQLDPREPDPMHGPRQGHPTTRCCTCQNITYENAHPSAVLFADLSAQ